ncbi:MAG: VWA domain-containing protein [Desulfobulbus sp.]
MTFAQPLWIIAGLIVCIGFLLLFRNLQARRQATLEKFAAAHLLGRLSRNVSTRKQFTKKCILLLALFCCFLALARPQYGFRWEEVKRKGIDILFAIDTSKSMLAADIKPNRLERAKLAVMDFVDQLSGDRVGLLPFAGSAFLMCPLTGDYQAFATSLNAVDTTIIPKGGTDIAAAIREATSVLSNEANYKLLVLITDGENLEGDVLQAAQEAAKKGMRIFTVGVGSREGEIIPGAEGGKGFIKDASGNFVVSRLDETTLTQIAEKSDGLYVPLGNKGQGLQTIYEKKLSLVPKEELTERRHKVPLERFQWPLAAAIGLMTLEFMMNTRKSKPFKLPFKLPFRKSSQPGRGEKLAGILLLLILSSLSFWPAALHAAGGEEAYNKGDYPKALDHYSQLLKKHPDDPRIQFDFGTAAYKNKKFDEALAAFNGALKSNDLDLQQKAYYNRGNTQCKKGEETLKTDAQQTLAQWQEAVDSYTASLELKPNDQDALYNRKLVQKKMEALKKQQENKPQQQQQQDQDKKQDSKETKDNKEGSKQDAQGQAPKQSNPQQKTDPEPNGKSGGEKKKDDSVQPKDNESQQQAATQAQEAAQEAKNAAAAKAKAEARIDDQRRKEGKMTREDAEQLLNSLKNEEGKVLNFVPTGGQDNDEPRRDW